ncbi:crosslink repair DNA glycosylase YcaQ family protein [Actinocorallia longicatena]|uniref:Crosslink repair DNA glycosylase YcaQ family protein n=1 Tax=Actinocorallia longicatena TaxID=111803 RepID=A0ABP6QEZ3_9ACTN
MTTTRAQVLAHRLAAHRFDRSTPDPDVLSLGVQDTPYGSARLALAARGASTDGLALVWAVRGAPHLHRRADLPALAGALWPLSDADAAKRIGSSAIKEGAKLGLAAFEATAAAFRAAVRAPMPKGAVSAAVSAAIPAELTFWCATCGSQHVSGLLFQTAGLFGAVELVPEGGGTTIAPLPEPFPVPAKAAGTAGYLETFLRLLGPGTPAEAAKFLGTSPTAARPAWTDADLTEIIVDGVRGWFPTEHVDALLKAPEPSPMLRLLPPGDPYLQTRNRPFLVPDKAVEKELWRPLGNPGAILLNGEIAGTWRPKLAGRRLDLTVTAFTELPRTELESEAALVGEVRGATTVRLL